MKKLFSILFLFLAVLSARADYITATVTITNVSSLNGSNIVVNGNTRTWYNSVTNTGTQIQATNVIGYAASNLFNHIAGSGFAGVALARSSTNGITLAGINLTVTASTGYCTISLVTNTTGGKVFPVVVPFSSTFTGTNLPYVASQLVTDIDANSTTAFSASSPALTNHVGLSTAQTITGAKNFSGANNYSNDLQTIVGGYTSNQSLINITTASGTLGNLTNGTFTNPSFTNGQNFGAPFRSPGTGTASEQFGYTAAASGDYSIAFGSQTGATGQGASAVGGAASAVFDNGTALGYQAAANAANGTAIGAQADVEHDSSTALGRLAVTSADHQIMLGTATEYVHMPGNAQIVGNVTNVHLIGTNTTDGYIAFLRKSNTSLANGQNAGIDLSTNYNITISGPTAAFSTDGFAGGNDGRPVRLVYRGGFTWTIPNESGGDSTASRRVQTGTGATVTLTNNPSFAELWYDTSVSRWVLGSHSN